MAIRTRLLVPEPGVDVVDCHCPGDKTPGDMPNSEIGVSGNYRRPPTACLPSRLSRVRIPSPAPFSYEIRSNRGYLTGFLYARDLPRKQVVAGHAWDCS